MHHLIDTPFEPHFEDVSQNVSEIIMGAGMTVDYLSIDPSIHSSFISGVGSVNRAAEPINTIEEANRAFNRSGYISSFIAARNADSLAFAAHHLDRRYQLMQTSMNTPRQ